jgi:hypothetical protein
MTEIETEEQRDERGKRLLARLRALDLTPAEQHEALVFLSGFSVSGVETALDRCERERRESLAENRRWPRADAAASAPLASTRRSSARRRRSTPRAS